MPARDRVSGLPGDCRILMLIAVNLLVSTLGISVLTFVAHMSHNMQNNRDAAGQIRIQSSASAVILAGRLA